MFNISGHSAIALFAFLQELNDDAHLVASPLLVVVHPHLGNGVVGTRVALRIVLPKPVQILVKQVLLLYA